MNIGFDAKRAFHNRSGLGNYSRFVIEALSQRYPDNTYFAYTPPYTPQAMQAFAQASNVVVRQPQGLWRALPSAWRSLGLTADARRDRVEVFHGLSHELPAGIEKTGMRTLVTMHDLIFLRYPQYYKPIDRAIYRKKFYSVCRRADTVIAISQQTKADIVNFFGIAEEKIKLVYQGCDPQFYSPVSDEEKIRVRQKYALPQRYVLSVGTVEERKNLLTLVRALPALPPDVHLVVVGRQVPAYAQKVHHELAALGLAARVSFIANASFKDFPAIYRSAAAFVYPSVFEGFGIPILEALSCEVPVVAANSSSLPEVGGSAALYMEPYDHATLADMLRSVLGDPVLAARMTAEGLLQAQKFREEETVPALWKLYSEG